MGIHVIDTVAGWPKHALAPRIIVSTVPETTTDARSGSGAMVISEAMFAYREGPAVFVDMAYKLSTTPLIMLGRDIENWTPIPGLAVLLEQGYRQFELWTGRRCPKVAVAEKAWTRYEKI
jgi:pentafunctional AROM polypeptide